MGTFWPVGALVFKLMHWPVLLIRLVQAPPVDFSVSFPALPVSSVVVQVVPSQVVLADQAAVWRVPTGSEALVDLVTTAT